MLEFDHRRSRGKKGQLEAADEFLAKLAEERLDPEDPGERGRSGSISAEEAAKYLTEKTGKEVTADMVVSHFGNLKKESLLADYRANRRKKSELWNIEQEIEEEERQAEGMEPFSSKPIEESEYRKKLRKAYEAEKAKEEQADMEKWLYASGTERVILWDTADFSEIFQGNGKRV